MGLMSGSSLDGVDVVAVRGEGRPEILAYREYPFEAEVRAALRDFIAEVRLACDLFPAAHTALGHVFADAVQRFLLETGIQARDVRALGMHGVTFRHLPKPVRVFGREVTTTCQWGDPAVIAARCGVTVVDDFRHMDMALGGQGAPLAPFIEQLYFADDHEDRAALNIGGIANVTLLPAGGGPIRAFDTGPGNMIIDALMAQRPGDPALFDADGAYAATGKVDAELLEQLRNQPYFQQRPPKSTGREMFGPAFVHRWFADRDHADLVATATAFTAHTIGDALHRFSAGHRPACLIVSGGGVYNKTLMAMLSEALPDVRLCSSEAFGLNPSAKEAVLTALLARSRMRGETGNFISVTGARAAAVLGRITAAGPVVGR